MTRPLYCELPTTEGKACEEPAVVNISDGEHSAYLCRQAYEDWLAYPNLDIAHYSVIEL